MFVTLHLGIPTSQKLLNSTMRCEKNEIFDVRGLNVLVMDELKHIKISSLKSLIVASLALKSEEAL